MYDIEGTFDQQILAFHRRPAHRRLPRGARPPGDRGRLLPGPLRAAGLPGRRGDGARRRRGASSATSTATGSSSRSPRAPSWTSRRAADLVEEFAQAQFELVPRAGLGGLAGRGAALGPRAGPLRHLGGAPRARRHGGGRADPRAQGLLPAHDPAAGAATASAARPGVFVLPDEHPDEVFPHNIVVFGDVGVNATMTPEVAGPGGGRHLRGGPRPHPRGRAARDPRRHRLVLEPRLGRGPLARAGAPGHRAGARGPGRAGASREPRYAHHPHRGRGQGLGGALAALGHVLPAGRTSATWEGSPNVIICPNLDMGNLLYHLYATRFPDGEEVPGHVRPALPRRRPGHGLHARGHPAGGQGLGAAHAPLRRVEAHAAGHLLPRATACWPSTPARPRPRSRVYEGEEERFTDRAAALGRGAAAVRGQDASPSSSPSARSVIAQALADHGLDASPTSTRSPARGGILHPVPHGTLAVNDDMVARPARRHATASTPRTWAG